LVMTLEVYIVDGLLRGSLQSRQTYTPGLSLLLAEDGP
jgi:hypothetical protein